MKQHTNGQASRKDRLRIFDTTLRDGEQAPGASMTVTDKIRIAGQLAVLGVDVIEAGFPISSPGQREAVERISADVTGPVICALARAVPVDVDAAGESLRGARSRRIHTFIATSDIHLNAKFDAPRYGRTIADKRRTILGMAVEAVAHARSYTDDVEFSAEDAGRTDIGFLCDVFRAVVDAGATTINIPDTTGYTTPAEYAGIFEVVRQECAFGPEIILSTHCHDDLGLAVANSLAAVRAGARQVECTINGLGERAGNASLEEVVMALAVRPDVFGLQTGIETRQLTTTSRLVELASGHEVPACKAIVGANAFSHEAGIHQDGVLKSRSTYEIMRAEDVGNDGESIRLGRHSGRHGLFGRLERLGIPVAKADRDRIYGEFVQLADRKKEVFDEDLRLIARMEQSRKALPRYTLEQISVSVDSEANPTAIVTVRNTRNGLRTTYQASGEGPIDALYSAIDGAVGETHDLLSYDIRSITQGADALGQVTVSIVAGRKRYSGSATKTDVILASANAYLEALNKLVVYRTDVESVEFVSNGIIRSFQ